MSASVGLLEGAQLKEVASQVKDYLGMQDVNEALARVLKRQPTLEESARATRMQPAAYQARLRRGQEAKALMLRANYRLVLKVVRPYQHRGLALQDLVTEGMHGLVRAVDKFEADKGFRFSTYAHWWIVQAVQRALHTQDRAVRLPSHVHERLGRIAAATVRLSRQLSRPPTPQEVAREVGLLPERVAEALALSSPSGSLDVPAAKGATDDSAGDAKDQLADERAWPDELAEQQDARQSLELALAHTLTPREALVLRLRWGLGQQQGHPQPEMTFEQIAQRLGVTRERVRQVQVRALAKLKKCHLELPAGVLKELHALPVHGASAGDGSVARVSRGTHKS